jgi:hypothetical protein
MDGHDLLVCYLELNYLFQGRTRWWFYMAVDSAAFQLIDHCRATFGLDLCHIQQNLFLPLMGERPEALGPDTELLF